jgi:hypothetical protein
LSLAVANGNWLIASRLCGWRIVDGDCRQAAENKRSLIFSDLSHVLSIF